MHDIVTSPEGYVAATGTLTFDASLLPSIVLEDQPTSPKPTRIKAQFTGKSLSKTGFNAPFDRTITVEARCIGQWCASPPSGRKALAFLKQSANGYSLDFSPCYSAAFFDPTRKMLNTVKRCYLENTCPNP